MLERVKKAEFFKVGPPVNKTKCGTALTQPQPVWNDIDSLMDPKLFVGNCGKIVEDYCNGEVKEKLARYEEALLTTETAQLSI